MSTCSRIFLVVATLTITCLVLSHQLPVDCGRNHEIYEMYIECVKSLGASQRYGKRSPPNQSPFLKKLNPRLFQDFARQPSRNIENLQDFYQLLEQDSN